MITVWLAVLLAIVPMPHLDQIWWGVVVVAVIAPVVIFRECVKAEAKS